MAEKLEGKTALVTGAGRGIGRAIAEAFLREGARVYGASRTEGDLEGLADAPWPGTFHPLAGDITDEAFVGRIFDRIEVESGSLDILINNAGVAPYGPIEEMPLEAFRSCIETNLIAAYHCMHLAISLMHRRGGAGRILNVASVRAHWSMYGDFGGYNASKAGLKALTESVARQLHGSGSRVTVGMISPGLVATRMTNPEEEPQPSWVQPETIADLVLHIVTGPAHVNYFDSVVFPLEQSPW